MNWDDPWRRLDTYGKPALNPTTTVEEVQQWLKQVADGTAWAAAEVDRYLLHCQGAPQQTNVEARETLITELITRAVKFAQRDLDALQKTGVKLENAIGDMNRIVPVADMAAWSRECLLKAANSRPPRLGARVAGGHGLYLGACVLCSTSIQLRFWAGTLLKKHQYLRPLPTLKAVIKPKTGVTPNDMFHVSIRDSLRFAADAGLFLICCEEPCTACGSVFKPSDYTMEDLVSRRDLTGICHPCGQDLLCRYVPPEPTAERIVEFTSKLSML